MKKTFIIGHPIKHSLSPKLHQFWHKKYNINATYEPFNLQNKRELIEFFKRLKKGEFIGGNITVPYKENALILCDEIDKSAREIGAINCVHIKQNQIYGFNSDWLGFLANLDYQVPDWANKAQQKQALILGAGGASRAIIYALLRRKFAKIHILNRTFAKAIDLAKDLGKYCGHDVQIIAHKFENFAFLAPNISILVNTTSIGMDSTKFDNLALDKLPKNVIINDIVYRPINTPLLIEAKKQGLKTVDGLGMLLNQAVLPFKKWFLQEPEIDDELLKYMYILLGEKFNLDEK